LERAVETAEPIAKARSLPIFQEPDLRDPNVGKWQGKPLKVLRRTNAWRIVQNAPSRFQFPEGESFINVQTRIVNALENIIKKHNKPKHIIAVVFHADPIKLAITYFIGLPLDHFQRLACETGSVSALYVSEMGAQLLKLNQRPPFDFLQNQKRSK
jgi:probable phosphoglycerate mutase